LVLMSRQYGLEPQQLLQYLQENNQLPVMFADVRRGLAVAAVVHGATVTDTDGNVIDTTEFFGPPAAPDANDVAAQIAAQVEAAGKAADAAPEQTDDAADDAAADDNDDTADESDEASADTK
jgi:trigger factor